MIEHTSTIEAAFQIEGRGCVVVPGIPRDADSHVKIGDHVYILHEHHDCIDTVIRGIGLIRAQPRLEGFPILLPKTITKDDIAIGAKSTSLKDRLATAHRGDPISTSATA